MDKLRCLSMSPHEQSGRLKKLPVVRGFQWANCWTKLFQRRDESSLRQM